MIYLTSNGITSYEISSHIGKNKNEMSKAVIITTASDEYKNDDYHIPVIKENLNSIGFNVDLLDIEFDDVSVLENYDLIYILGGNPFYLLYHLKITNLEDILLNHIRNKKIIIGSSAGSVVLTNNIEIVNEFDSDLNKKTKLVNFKGLGLVDIEICPHIKRFEQKFENFNERLKKYESRNKVTVKRIDDGEAIFIEGKTIEYI